MTYFNLGEFNRAITTKSEEAGVWANRGLIWTYAYNHQEAIACFQKALEHDETCAFAYWGIAYASGPNYNLPWRLYDQAGKELALAAAFDATAMAHKNMAGTTPVEQALIKALGARYPQRDPIEDQSGWDDDFADAMRQVYQTFPADLEVRAIFAEAIMNRTPWQMWDLKSGNIAKGAGTAEARDVLESAFQDSPQAWRHPGLLHLYIHLMEMSPFPQKALRVGDHLRTLVPDAGHLIHMPTHIDILCGLYQDVVVYNEKAIAADHRYLDQADALSFYALYRAHNYHFAIYGAMFLGRGETALKLAEALIETIPEALLLVQSPPMADFVEAFISMKQHVLVRFGKWHEIIAQSQPNDDTLYCCTTAFMYYAKSVAHSALGNIVEAENERSAFLAAKAKVPETRLVHNNKVVDLLDIAEEMLNGELEYRRGNFDVAFAHLRQSVALDDALPYDEPWGWMQPTRHALGALLLEQNRAEEAEKIYRADLGLDQTLSRACQHPNNIWSLHGLYECLQRRGEKVESPLIKQQLDLAQARAEVEVRASCFCRRSSAA